MAAVRLTRSCIRAAGRADMNEIFTRVSIRKYRDRPVEPEKIERILRAAMAAPSARNDQPWELFVVTDKARIAELSGAHEHAGFIAAAPVLIVPCFRTRGAMAPGYDYINMSAATENLLLEVTAQGLGACWIGIAPRPERIEFVNKALGIGDELCAFAIVAVGYPAEDKPQQDRYDESRVHWV